MSPQADGSHAQPTSERVVRVADPEQPIRVRSGISNRVIVADQGDLEVCVVDAAGKPLAGVELSLRHKPNASAYPWLSEQGTTAADGIHTFKDLPSGRASIRVEGYGSGAAPDATIPVVVFAERPAELAVAAVSGTKRLDVKIVHTGGGARQLIEALTAAGRLLGRLKQDLFGI